MKGYALAIIATLFYSPVGVFTKLIGDNIHPISLVFYRLLFAFIVIALIIPKIDKTTFKANSKDIKEYAFVGFF